MQDNYKECEHNNIESNMCPDTCKDCGKVLTEVDNYKELREKFNEVIRSQFNGIKWIAPEYKQNVIDCACDFFINEFKSQKEKGEIELVEKIEHLILSHYTPINGRMDLINKIRNLIKGK